MMEVLSAKARLAQSRAALLAAMTPRVSDAPPPSTLIGKVEAKVERSVVGRWWRRSHMSSAVEIGTPFLQEYAGRHPARLMAGAAGVGALIVLVKPWRLLSLGMVVGLIVRSTDIAGLIGDYIAPQLGGEREDLLDPHP